MPTRQTTVAWKVLKRNIPPPLPSRYLLSRTTDRFHAYSFSFHSKHLSRRILSRTHTFTGMTFRKYLLLPHTRLVVVCRGWILVWERGWGELRGEEGNFSLRWRSWAEKDGGGGGGHSEGFKRLRRRVREREREKSLFRRVQQLRTKYHS